MKLKFSDGTRYLLFYNYLIPTLDSFSATMIMGRRDKRVYQLVGLVICHRQGFLIFSPTALNARRIRRLYFQLCYSDQANVSIFF